LRIIGGIYKGRKITIGKRFDSRPTTDFAKEALFNILANHFDFSTLRVLDLFGGTGSISYEFASRGCSEIEVIDTNSNTLHDINDFAETLNIKGIHTVRMDAFRFIAICKKQYDIIFADPPYDLKTLPDIPPFVFKHPILISGGWFILEHSKKYRFTSDPHFLDERSYGNVHFSFFKRNID
jgi:16S rRNA (guanine966-N2)-methyltransferase